MLIMLYNNVIKCIKINAPALEIYRNKENIQKTHYHFVFHAVNVKSWKENVMYIQQIQKN